MRQLQPRWNASLVAASIVISLLGAFTSTQLVCQARLSRHVHAALLWMFLASLTFGFCSVWCLHFVAMLAYELDLPIGLNVPLTVLSACLAVLFTFIALASELIWEHWTKKKRRLGTCKSRRGHVGEYNRSIASDSDHSASSEPLISPTQRSDGPPSNSIRHLSPSPAQLQPLKKTIPEVTETALPFRRPAIGHNEGGRAEGDQDDPDDRDDPESSSEHVYLRRQSDSTSEISSFGLGFMHRTRSRDPGADKTRNSVAMMVIGLWQGLSFPNIAKGFFWSLAITSMHYSGIMALKIPEGGCVLNPALVLLSAVISWVVCTVGCILMAQMETFLIQQILFAIVVTLGVAAMHFTGMSAARFWSNAAAQETRGYPQGLSVTIVCIAALTCLSANGLLVHSATVARNKFSEIIRTRRKLWAALAQKEHAEAAAQARSEFIASASHEIRTPLHQLQGYSDLLSREQLTEEGRTLLCAIQDATKTLSLITNNVLDWSRLEKGEAANRPTFIDIRSVIDAVITLLPNKHGDDQVEILVSISPNVPGSLLMDELSLTRIILNLLSNACKFTTHGYVLLTVKRQHDRLIIAVEDTGCGVPRSFFPQLFEPFKQAQTRGAERGTGLGLSIVKQLLAKMEGTIEVDSNYRNDPGIGPDKQGSTFTVTIPLLEGPSSADGNAIPDSEARIAVLETHNARLIGGLKKAWAEFGVEVQEVALSQLSTSFKYVWASASALAEQPELLRHLLAHTDWLVLVPYDNENRLYEVLGAQPPPHLVPVRRPLAWHRIMKSINAIRDMPPKAEVTRPSVRFAANVQIMNGDPPATNRLTAPVGRATAERQERPFMIMLVEDNKINQKLGVRMLKSYGYDVVVADDGQEAIDILIEKDEHIDLILMDQSMPRKDGLQATKEIRHMEEQGRLKGSRRFQNTDRARRRVIIAVTAVAGPAHEAMCKTVGTDAFLPKPLSMKRLKEALAIWLHDASDQTNGI